jgi:hypothetical protein
MNTISVQDIQRDPVASTSPNGQCFLAIMRCGPVHGNGGISAAVPRRIAAIALGL